jgi:hypothetical protein
MTARLSVYDDPNVALLPKCDVLGDVTSTMNETQGFKQLFKPCRLFPSTREFDESSANNVNSRGQERQVWDVLGFPPQHVVH